MSDSTALKRLGRTYCQTYLALANDSLAIGEPRFPVSYGPQKRFLEFASKHPTQPEHDIVARSSQGGSFDQSFTSSTVSVCYV